MKANNHLHLNTGQIGPNILQGRKDAQNRNMNRTNSKKAFANDSTSKHVNVANQQLNKGLESHRASLAEPQK